MPITGTGGGPTRPTLRPPPTLRVRAAAKLGGGLRVPGVARAKICVCVWMFFLFFLCADKLTVGLKVMVNGYVAAPKDDSLEEYLIEALFLLEIRFKKFDTDGAG